MMTENTFYRSHWRPSRSVALFRFGTISRIEIVSLSLKTLSPFPPLCQVAANLWQRNVSLKISFLKFRFLKSAHNSRWWSVLGLLQIGFMSPKWIMYSGIQYLKHNMQNGGAFFRKYAVQIRKNTVIIYSYMYMYITCRIWWRISMKIDA